MRLAINQLIQNGQLPTRILYVSLDDYLLRSASILDVVTTFRQIQKLSVDERVYLFLDEVTAKADFHQQIKNLFDREDVVIVAAASSSSLLKDSRAFLTGRSKTIEVFPLTFEEYLEFKDVHLHRRDGHLVDRYFRDYVRDGGLPENVLEPSREYLMNLVDDIIQKDITAFHGLKDHQILRDFFTLLMERSGKQVSINKVANILGISPDTSRRYLGYFEDTYLVHLVSRSGTTNERLLSPKKIYACDLGVKHLFVGDRDWGSYFENYVYQRIREYQEVFYVKIEQNELDFLTSDGTLVEAKYNSEIQGKQKEVFDTFDAERKVVVGSVGDLVELTKGWET